MNVTNEQETKVDPLQVVANVSDIVTGSLAFVSNFIVLLLFIFSKSLKRKELFILFGLVAGDFIYGLGCFVGGIKRLNLVLKNQQFSLVSPWFCQTQFETFCYIYGPKLSALMNMMISIDRLMSIALAHVYQRLTIRYVFTVTGAVFGFVTVSYLTGLALSTTIPATERTIALCFSTLASWPSYGTYYTTLIAVANCSSVLIYCVVMIVLKNRVKHASVEMQNVHQKRQNKVTRTIGIISLADFLLNVVPFMIQTSVNSSNLPSSIADIIIPVSWMFVSVNCVVRFIIYVSKLNEIRKALAAFLSCKITCTVQVGTTVQVLNSQTNQRTTNI